MRVYEAQVSEKMMPVRLSRYLRRAFPLIPEHELKNAVKNRDVRVNGVRISGDDPIAPGSSVRLYTAFEAELSVLYEDEMVLMLEKPAGLSSDEDEWGGMTVLSEAARSRPMDDLRLVHRLDNQTCGLIVLAKGTESERCLLNAFEQRNLDKRYQCLVKGVMRPSKGQAQAYLVRDSVLNRVRVVTHATPGAKTIRTAWETIGQEGELTRLSVSLLTGRTHQIRAHMAFLSHPILGDDVYGDRTFNHRLHAEGKLRLCSWRMTLWAGGVLSYLDGRTFSAQVPF